MVTTALRAVVTFMGVREVALSAGPVSGEHRGQPIRCVKPLRDSSMECLWWSLALRYRLRRTLGRGSFGSQIKQREEQPALVQG